VKKNAKMLRVEKAFGAQLEEFLPTLMNEHEGSIVATKLGISRNSVYNWALRLGLRHIWVGPENVGKEGPDA